LRHAANDGASSFETHRFAMLLRGCESLCTIRVEFARAE
jgi:hypothetical protein